MADTATITYNPDRSAVEIEIGAGDDDPSFGPIDVVGDDPLIVCADAEKPDQPCYLAVCGAYEGLQPDTVYLLTPVRTEVMEVDNFDDDTDDDADDDADDDGAEGEPVAS